jgi:hypothetical protein
MRCRPPRMPQGLQSRAVSIVDEASDPSVLVIVPVRIKAGLNAREHWAAKHRRVRTERQTTKFLLVGLEPLEPPLVVTLTRLIGPRGQRMDDDNLAGGMKSIRDEVARWLGVDDRDPRVRYVCEQRKADEWGVEIRVDPA